MKKKKTDGRVNNGGVRENSGRKKAEKVLTNYEKAYKILDDDIEANLTFLQNVRDNNLEDTKISMTERVRASQLLLTRTIPEKKEPEKILDIAAMFNPEFTNWSDEKLDKYVKGE